MHVNSKVTQAPIFHVNFDRIIIVSTAPVAVLKERLPIADFEATSHSFNVIGYKGDDPRLQAIITIVGPRPAALQLFAENEPAFQKYRIVELEIACDRKIEGSEGHAALFELAAQLRKPWHQRGHLSSVHLPDREPRVGCFAEPTFYFENRHASVRLKCYLRQQKLPSRAFGRGCLRLEWTIKGKRALNRHVGGNKFRNLLQIDFRQFLHRNLRLERVDHVAIGRLFRLRGGGAISDEVAHRIAVLVLRRLANAEAHKFADWEQAYHVALYSPSQVRGWLRTLRAGSRPRRRGRPKHKSLHRRPITDYRINKCFVRLQLPARIIIADESKSAVSEPDKSDT